MPKNDSTPNLPALPKSAVNAITKINDRHQNFEQASEHAAESLCAEAEKIGNMLNKEKEKHREREKKKADKSTKIRWESLFVPVDNSEKSRVLTAFDARFLMSYGHASKYQSLANRPYTARKVTRENGVFRIDAAAKACSNATDADEEAARLMFAGASPKTLAAKFTGNDEWYTPPEYIEAARAAMGSIDTDPASNEEAQKIVRAGVYYTAENCGLKEAWRGNVWMNPPYSKTLMPQFMAKLLEEWSCRNFNQAIVLTNNNTDTAWFHDAAREASAICFTKGRISFYCGPEQSSPTNGQTFFYFGDSPVAFFDAFSAFGMVCHVAQ